MLRLLPSIRFIGYSPDTSIADTIAPTDTIPTDEAIDAKDTVNPVNFD